MIPAVTLYRTVRRLLVLGGITLAAAQGQAADADILCALSANPAPGGMLQLQGVVEAGSAHFLGHYNLSVVTSGTAGRSSSMQAGRFQLAPTERKVVGSVSVGKSAAQVRARLTITSAAGEVCTADY